MSEHVFEPGGDVPEVPEESYAEGATPLPSQDDQAQPSDDEDAPSADEAPAEGQDDQGDGEGQEPEPEPEPDPEPEPESAADVVDDAPPAQEGRLHPVFRGPSTAELNPAF